MATRKFAANRTQVARKVVNMRHAGQSWLTIGAELGCSAITARRMYEEAKGTGAHYVAWIKPGRFHGDPELVGVDDTQDDVLAECTDRMLGKRAAKELAKQGK